MDEIEEEEFVKLKYMRDDEEPVPWEVNHLAKPPMDGSLGFYELSKFAVYKNIIRPNLVLKFPDYLWVSRNYFHLQWCLRRQCRRLKNVIIILEWTPSYDEGGVMAYIKDNILGWNKEVQLTSEQEARLKKSFELFDGNNDGYLNETELGHVRYHVYV